MKPTTTLAALATLLAPAAARADLGDDLAAYGLGASAGLGVVEFAHQDMPHFDRGGGGWEARLGIGTKRRLTIEAAYVGSVHFEPDSGAALLGTSLESDVRVNLLRGRVQPYALAGAGWARYSLHNAGAYSDDNAASGNIAVFPLGLGASVRLGRATIDLRGVYRATTTTDMFVGTTGDMASWSAMLRGGFEY